MSIESSSDVAINVQTEMAAEDLEIGADRIEEKFGITVEIPEGVTLSTESLKCLDEALSFFGSSEIKSFVSKIVIDTKSSTFSTIVRQPPFPPILKMPRFLNRPELIVHELAHARDFSSNGVEKDFFGEIYEDQATSGSLEGAEASVAGDHWDVNGEKKTGPLFGFVTPYGLTRDRKEDISTQVEVAFYLYKNRYAEIPNLFDANRSTPEFASSIDIYKKKIDLLYSGGFLGKHASTQAEEVRQIFLDRLLNKGPELKVIEEVEID